MELSSYETIIIEDGSSSSIGSSGGSVVSIQYDNEEAQQQQVRYHDDEMMIVTEIEDVREDNRSLNHKEDMEAKLMYCFEQGKLYHEQNVYDQALYMYNQALELAQHLQQKRSKRSLYNNDKYEEDIIKINYQIGWLHYEQQHQGREHHLSQALEYFVKGWNAINTRRKRREEERSRMAASNASKGKPPTLSRQSRKQSSISRDYNEQLLLEDDIYDVLEDMKYSPEQIKSFFTNLRTNRGQNTNHHHHQAVADDKSTATPTIVTTSSTLSSSSSSTTTTTISTTTTTPMKCHPSPNGSRFGYSSPVMPMPVPITPMKE